MKGERKSSCKGWREEGGIVPMGGGRNGGPGDGEVLLLSRCVGAIS